jgi:hypothetical protein
MDRAPAIIALALCTAEATLPHHSFVETDIAGCRLTVILRPRMLNGETRVVATGCHDDRR